MNIENALKIEGWTSEAELLWLAEQASKRTRIAEIGSWKGRSTRAMADNTPGVVIAVDTWKGTKEDGHDQELDGKPASWLYDEFVKNNAINTTTIQLPSVEAAAWITNVLQIKFDMIFIDAAHDYESVKADILAWRPLLEEGGLFCGHDYDAGRPGVVRAVRELVPNVQMAGAGSIWTMGKI